jgi:uncharacterized protein
MDLALPALADRFSVVTLSERRVPAWSRLLDWPVAGNAHVPVRARRLSDRNLLAAKIDRAVLDADRAVLLVAEGAGCFAAAWWARLSPADYVGRVAGALFFEPGAKDEARFASPRVALPFPSVLVGDDEVRALADGWGSSVVDGEEGPLLRAQRAVHRFTAAVVEREVRSGERLWMGIVR